MMRFFRIGALFAVAWMALQSSAMPLGYRLSRQARVAVRQAMESPDSDPTPTSEPPPTPIPEPIPEPTPIQPTFTPETVIAGTVNDTSFLSKAQTMDGALYTSGGNLVGTVQVKFGKIGKKGVKVSGTATLLIDGKVKKVTAKAVNVMLDATGRIPSVKIAFKEPIGEMSLEMADDGKFKLKNGSYLMVEASVGGALKGGAQGTFRIEGFDLAVPGELQEDLLPLEESFGVSGGKWSFAKAAGVKWAKDKAASKLGGERFVFSHGAGCATISA